MEHQKKTENNKAAFIAVLLIVFVTILIYEALTPMLSDDLNYGIQVRKASSAADLFRQEAEQWRGWSGRSVAHIILRFFLYFNIKAVFNVVAAVCFTLTAYLTVRLSKGRGALLIASSALLMWMFAPSFAETVLWETGACNYLITTTIILSCLMCVRHILDVCKGNEDAFKKNIPVIAGMLVLGIISGWCNENTSGGMVLIILMWLFFHVRDKYVVPLPVITCLIGNIIGLLFMVLAPGNSARALVKDEAHTGLMLLAARFLKVTKAMKDEFLIPILIFAVLLLYLYMIVKEKDAVRDMCIYGIAFLATSYVLVAAPEPQDRALYGAGIFLFTGILTGLSALLMNEDAQHMNKDTQHMNEGAPPLKEVHSGITPRFVITSAVICLTIIMSFTYIDCGANLARVRRDVNTRYSMIREAASRGEETVYLPLLHKEFDNPYTMAYESDLSTDWDYWVNYAFVEYFGVEQVIGVERELWEEEYE